MATTLFAARSLRHRLGATCLCLCLPLATSSCGTLLYPDRSDVDGDDRRLDAAVIAMDGILLLFGILPGVIAFAVDAHTGALYLPPGVDAPQAPEAFDED